jgi:AcrR family transcriptional regulator
MSSGLRERKKQATRETIADAAMKLFSQRGFDAVTVAEVADEAGVSEKTVFNYFPTKEDLFFDEIDEREAALLASLRSRKPGESMLAALSRTAAANCERLTSEHFGRFAKLVEDAPSLQTKERQMFGRFTRTVADELVAEGVPEAEAAVASAAVAGVYAWMFATARTRALAGEHGPTALRRLRKEVARGFALLDRGLGAFARKQAS